MPHRVLLCDDEIHILRAAEFKFTKAGYEVCCANNGLEAWEAIQREKPDVLITDCQMPRLDGIGLCKRIREHEAMRDLPVFMLTAKGYELSHKELKEQLGVLAVIAKPFSPRELLQRVDEVCGRTPSVPTILSNDGRLEPRPFLEKCSDRLFG
ncbi:MAG TPA: response regulator [Pirellulales bacterium]|jgi:DNA-binding response OmpR family regulator|nr:response regulator [Pirellulales bacterium]